MKYKIVEELESSNITLGEIPVGSFFYFTGSAKSVYIKLSNTIHPDIDVLLGRKVILVMLLTPFNYEKDRNLYSYSRKLKVVLLEQVEPLKLRYSELKNEK